MGRQGTYAIHLATTFEAALKAEFGRLSSNGNTEPSGALRSGVLQRMSMSIELAFVTYATKRIADLRGSIEKMEAGTVNIIEQVPGEDPKDTTKDTLGAQRAKLKALESLKGQIEAGGSA
ncbi:hypothetical protein ASF60_21050 [Methylobacterium sp. Leaf113]|nr:hypothetical protein ASF60_21050 [Methylobacterium sp. Leaf113]